MRALPLFFSYLPLSLFSDAELSLTGFLRAFNPVGSELVHFWLPSDYSFLCLLTFLPSCQPYWADDISSACLTV